MGFFVWHYGVGLALLWEAGLSLSLYLTHHFSIGVIVATLFSPWRRIYFAKQRAGFDLTEWFNRAMGNVISSLLGFTIRLCLILIWVVAELLLWILWLATAVIWLIVPPISWFWYQTWKSNDKDNLREISITDEAVLGRTVTEVLESERFKFVGLRLGIDMERDFISSQISQEAVRGAIGRQVTMPNLTKWIWQVEPKLAELLRTRNVSPMSLSLVFSWYERVMEAQKTRREFWRRDRLLAGPGIADSFAYGFTPTLDKFSIMMSNPKEFHNNLVGRDRVVAEMERCLAMNRGGNVILSGEPGVGKKTVVYALAKKIYENRCMAELRHKMVYMLDVATLIAKSGNNEAKMILKQVFSESAAAGNIILVIDNLDQYVTAGEDRSDYSDVITQALSEARVKIVGITNPAAYQKYIYPNGVIRQYFDLVEVVAPTKEEALIIAQDYVLAEEKGRKILVLEQAIEEAVERSDKLISDTPFPEKAIDLLEETMVYCVNELHQSVVTAEHVDIVLSEKLKIPLGELKSEEIEKLRKFEQLISKKIVGQDEAVVELAMSLRRTRLLEGKVKSLGTFLFLGPTGVGKTETAKVLAEAYFGSSEAMDRLDMAEFQGDEAVERLIGSVRTREPGIIVKMLREKPFGVLLIDELEKAPQTVTNLFLTVLDEGYLTDAWGKKVSVVNKLIIATTNAGSEYIRQQVASGVEYEKLRNGLIDFVLKERIFTPEFVNRFGATVVFRPLSLDSLMKIALLWFSELNERLMRERKIKVKVTNELLLAIGQQGYDPQFGARYMKRAFARIVEDKIAQKILSGEASAGQELEIVV